MLARVIAIATCPFGGTTMTATNDDGHMEDYDGQIHDGHKR